MEDQAFLTVAKESVHLIAETVGHGYLSDDVACILGEDVSYRLREVVMKSAGYMKNAKRRRMCPEDFNQALRDSDVQPVLGNGADGVPFRQTREGDLHFVEDSDINLNNVVYSSYVSKHLGYGSLKAHWLAVEGVQKTSNSSHLSSHSRPNKKMDPVELMQYYSEITKSLVGSDMTAVKIALSDLCTNASVPALLPYFVSFVANGVKAVSHDVSKLTLLMRTVESLVQNPAVFLEPQPYLSLLVHSVENCLLEPLAVSISPMNDHWMLRDYAARLLAHIVRRWNSSVNHLNSSTVLTLSKTLQDLSRPFCSHYGAVMGLVSLGCKELEEVLIPHLPSYWPHLLTGMEDMSRGNAVVRCDALKVYGAILLASQILLRNKIKQFEDLVIIKTENKCDQRLASQECKSHVEDTAQLHQQLYDYFGDSLSIQLPVLGFASIFGVPVNDSVISVGGVESEASGDKLLADLVQQVQQEELERQQHHSLPRYRTGSHTASSEDVVGDSDPDMALPSHGKSDVSDDSEEGGHTGSFSQQLAVSSTISDPSKGTLKLKISKRQMQQQQHGSPSQSPASQPRLTLQINKSWAETDHHQQHKDVFDRHRHGQLSSSVHESFNLIDSSDPEEHFKHPAPTLPTQIYSPGSGSDSNSPSGSDLNWHHKGKLTLKLKVPSKESVSE